MTKRIVAALLWFFAGWYLGAFVAYYLGLSELIGPVIGAVLAALVAGDPTGLVWRRAAEVERARAATRARLDEFPATH